MSQVTELNDNNFNSTVKENKGYVLVDFWAPWCGPCRQLSPIFEEVSTTMSDKVKFTKVNIDDSPEVASELGIRSIPTLLLFKDGEKVDSRLGAMSKTALESWLNEAII